MASPILLLLLVTLVATRSRQARGARPPHEQAMPGTAKVIECLRRAKETGDRSAKVTYTAVNDKRSDISLNEREWCIDTTGPGFIQEMIQDVKEKVDKTSSGGSK